MFNARTVFGSLLRFLLGFVLLLLVALGLAAITSSDAQEVAKTDPGEASVHETAAPTR